MPDFKSKKKRKRGVPETSNSAEQQNGGDVDTSKPTAVFKPTGKGRQCTLSIALPGSIIANCQTHEIKTALAGRIARAAAVFCVDEIIVFNDGQNHTGARKSNHSQNHHRIKQGYHQKPNPENEDGYTGYSDPDNFLYHVLSFLECPPYLRKHLFPLHPNLSTAGTLPSLDMPHHLKAYEWCRYREGVTVEGSSIPRPTNQNRKPNKKTKFNDSEQTGTYVDAGFPAPVFVPGAEIPPSNRVSLDFGSETPPASFPFPQATDRPNDETVEAAVTHPSAPREEGGYYWGYEIRLAENLSAALDHTQSPLLAAQAGEDGISPTYDVKIGTSERGSAVGDIMPSPLSAEKQSHSLPQRYKHALIVFGGVAGLEVAAEYDPELKKGANGKSNVSEAFDYWVNVVPGQGSRTIRTEEAVWLALGRLWEWTKASW